MSLPALLILSFLAVRCGGCDFDWEGVKNIHTTIESIPTRFRHAFPKDYYVHHHYTSSMLCDSDPCCVFPAAVVLVDSWTGLLKNLWDEHAQYKLIYEVKQTLDTILRKNKHTEILQEETNISRFPSIQSSPEELLNHTAELLSHWLKVGCSASIETCLPPILPMGLAKRVENTLRDRLLITKAERCEEEGPKMDSTQQLSSSSPLVSQTLAIVWSPLFFGLFWGLLPY